MKNLNSITRIAGSLLVIFMFSTAAAEAQLKADIFQFVNKSDHNAITTALLNGDDDVNRTTKVGNTALMCAAKIGDYAVIKSLLDNGADVNMQNKAGGTAMMIAAKYGHPHVVDELLKRGADPTIKTKRGYTAAVFALGYKHLEVYNQLKKAENRFFAIK